MTSIYHLRVTIDRVRSISLIDLFIDKFKPKMYIFAFEEKGDNKHIHGHLEYDCEPKKQTVSDFFKRQQLTGKYYHKNAVKEHNNKLYVLKDLDLIKTSLTEEEIQKLTDEIEDIKQDMKTDVRHKLREQIKQRFDKLRKEWDDFIGSDVYYNLEDKSITIPHYTYSWVRRSICDIYVNEWDKEPPFGSRIQQYAMYIILKDGCHRCIEELYTDLGYN